MNLFESSARLPCSCLWEPACRCTRSMRNKESKASLKGNRSGRGRNNAHSLSNVRSHSNGRNRNSALNSRSSMRSRRNAPSPINPPLNPPRKATGPHSREATLLLSAAGNRHKTGSSRVVGGRTAPGRSTQPGRRIARPTGRAITALGRSVAAMAAITSPKLVSASTLELGTCFASEANPA